MLRRRFGIKKRFWQALKRAAGNERGGVAIIFGLVIIPAIAFMGVALDSWRAYDSASAASAALDSAALATARAMSDQDLSDIELAEVAQNYFDANTANSGASGTVYSNLKVLGDRVSNTVTVSVDTHVPTTFAGILKVDEVAMQRSATATFNSANIELAMMLDVTGSMRGQKIEDLKAAAKSVADILLGDEASAKRARIALAPYSASVNAGDYAERVSDYTSQDGCVFERAGAHAFDDFPPLAGTFLGAMSDPGDPDNDHYGCPPAPVLPMSNSVTLIKDTINGYGAKGYTAGHLGIAWSWYLISPDWAGVWPAESQPVHYGSDDTIKAVILMTDGQFNTSYENGSQNRTSSQQARLICNNMKNEDVIVYAVAFQAPSAARATLEDCASSSANFFDASSGEELKQAFRSIAINLKKLRISK